MAMFDPSRVVLVLVEPRQPGNIGAVCRAMANFGACELRLVNPCDRFHPEAVKFAVSAKHLLGEAKLYEDLPSALADLHCSVAMTRRTGRLRGDIVRIDQLPDQFGQLPVDGRVGLVFGREDCGLSTDEVIQCSHAATIETTGEKGSLNLAQAVVVALYEMSRQRVSESEVARVVDMPTQHQVESLFVEVEKLIDLIGFSNPSRPEVVPSMLRHLLTNASPDMREFNMLRGLVEQVSQSVQGWPGKRRG